MDVLFVTESNVLSFVSLAIEFGHKKLVLVSDKSLSKKLCDDLIKNTNIEFDFITSKQILLGTSKNLEKKSKNYFFGFEIQSDKDGMHQRFSGLNHVLLNRIKEREQIVLFTLNVKTNLKKSMVLGRIKQNLKLCKKYSVEYYFVSNAKRLIEIKSASDLLALENILSKI